MQYLIPQQYCRRSLSTVSANQYSAPKQGHGLEPQTGTWQQFDKGLLISTVLEQDDHNEQ